MYSPIYSKLKNVMKICFLSIEKYAQNLWSIRLKCKDSGSYHPWLRTEFCFKTSYGPLNPTISDPWIITGWLGLTLMNLLWVPWKGGYTELAKGDRGQRHKLDSSSVRLFKAKIEILILKFLARYIFTHNYFTK